MIAASTGAFVCARMIAAVANAIARPSATPIVAPKLVIATDSERNCTRISRSRAPVALRIPISLVRSATDASSTFMIPIPPTSSDTPVIAPMSSLNTSIPCAICFTRP